MDDNGVLGMKKASILLFLVLILVSTLPVPVVMALTETLYVNAFNSVIEEWDETGASPWLDNDQETGISTSVDDEWHDEFLFPDHGVTGTLNSVFLWIEVNGPSARNDKVYIYLWGEAGAKKSIEWVLIAQLDSDDDVYTWYNYDVSTVLHDWTTVDAAKLKLQYQRSGSASTQTIYVRRAYLIADYSAAGQEYDRPASQSISVSMSASRALEATRTATQGVDIALGAAKIIAVSRGVSQSIGVVMNGALGLIEVSRSASQAIGVAIGSEAYKEILRTASQAISIAMDGALGLIEVSRTATQSINVALDGALGLIEVSRSASQAIGISLQALGVKGGEYFRNAALSISLTISATGLGDRLWGLLNVVVKTLAGDPIEEAVVSLLNLNGTSYFTNSTGYIPMQNLTKGNYTIIATKDGFQVNNTIFQLLQDGLHEIRLMTLEEAGMVRASINLLAIFGTFLGIVVFVAARRGK